MDETYVPAPDNAGPYAADKLILYGVKLNAAESYAEFAAGEKGDDKLQLQLVQSETAVANANYSIVLGYGYAFEGHCYRFDKTRIFVVQGKTPEPASGCGYDKQEIPAGNARVYSMWRLRAADDLVEICMDYGDVRKLILDANLPGRRAPSSYAITASLAHRDGRFHRE